MKAELNISELKNIFLSIDKKKLILKFLNSLIVVSFRNISVYSHSPYSQNFKEISNDILNILKNGCLVFIRGSVFYDLATTFEKVLRSYILNISFKFGIFRNEDSKSFQLSNDILDLYLQYPKKMLFDCIVFSRSKLNFTEIIKLFLNYSSSSSPLPLLTLLSPSSPSPPSLLSLLSSLSLTKLYGSIYHGSFYSIMLMLSSNFIQDYVCNELDYYLNKYFNKYNHENKLIRIIIRSLVKSIIVSPFYVINSIYPSRVISSIVLNESIPPLVDPISIAILIYKNHGFKYFYKGLLPQFAFEFTSSFYSKIN
ncbi:hypothetical protein ACTFIY_001130 [Dictyostelium cf. discoideum]